MAVVKLNELSHFQCRSGLLNNSIVTPINLRYANVTFSVSPSSNLNAVDLLIIVKSARKNQQGRDIVRQTWGNSSYLQEELLKPHNVSAVVYFICGKSSLYTGTEDDSKLMEEVEVHNDMIIADFKDSYKNLTYKSLSAFKWALQEFQGEFKYLALLDDDIFVDIGPLGYFLKNIKDTRVVREKSNTTGYPYFRVALKRDRKTFPISDITTGLMIGNVRPRDPALRYPSNIN